MKDFISEARKKIIVGIDVETYEEAERIVIRMAAAGITTFKVGSAMIMAFLAERTVNLIHSLGCGVFYDGKINDTDKTMGKSSKAGAKNKFKMFNVHMSAGMNAVMKAVDNKGDSLLFVVTILSSLTEEEAQLIFGTGLKAKVLQFAREAKLAGCDGIICSPQELEFLVPRRELQGLLFTTPGVRSPGIKANDQKRVLTPKEAILAGATMIVTESEVTGAAGDRMEEALEKIVLATAGALYELELQKVKSVLGLDRQELLELQPEQITWQFTPDEVFHIAKELGAFWSYNYESAKNGKPGLHAELKSKLHSDGFFASKILLASGNMLKIMADQMVMRLENVYGDKIYSIDYIGGVPDGALALGQEVCNIIGAKLLVMEKRDKKIVLITEIAPGETFLLIEDICTQGTGFKEAYECIIESQPKAIIIPYDPVIFNRGGLMHFDTFNGQTIMIVPIAQYRINDWDPEKSCKLCNLGSTAIKPKETDENWAAINNSQK